MNQLSYYEILETDESVEYHELKGIYKKMSLKWHPDKNPDNVEEATEKFKLIREAYKVLSNHNDRVWYDRKREKLSTKNIITEQEIYEFMNNARFEGFGDDDKGFYAVYRDIFAKIAVNELECCQNIGKMTKKLFPDFGYSQSSFDYVIEEFYSYWESFSSKLPFFWHDKYTIHKGDFRCWRRLNGIKNNSLRHQAKVKFNLRIREFVATIKNKDPRVKAYREQMVKKQEKDEEKAKMMKQRAWERNKQLYDKPASEPTVFTKKSYRNFGNKNCLNDDLPNEKSETYCLPCQKVFKSNKAFNNHCNSKLHKKNFEELQKEMQKISNETNDERDRNINETELLFERRDENNIGTKTTEAPNVNVKKSTADINDSKNIGKSEPLIYENESVSNSLESELEEDTKITNLAEEISRIIDGPSQQCSNAIAIPDNDLGFKKRRRKIKEEQDKILEIEDKKTVSELTTFTCLECQYEFESKKKLLQHSKSTGHKLPDDKRDSCEICGLVYPSQKKLLQHTCPHIVELIRHFHSSQLKKLI